MASATTTSQNEQKYDDKCPLSDYQYMLKTELLDIDNINTREETVDVHIKFTSKYLQEECTVSGNQELLFKPGFSLDNVRTIHNMNVSIRDAVPINDGVDRGMKDWELVTIECEINATLKTEFDTNRYPFDSQAFLIGVTMNKIDPEGRKYELIPWKSKGDDNGFVASIDEHNVGWNLNEAEPLITYSKGAINDTITISIIARRLWKQPALALIVPQFCIAAAITLALRVKDVADGINLHFTAVLSAVVFTMVTFQNLPPSGSVSLAQRYNLFVILYILAMMGTSTVIYDKDDDLDFEDDSEFALFMVFGGLFIVGNVYFMLKVLCGKPVTHESVSAAKKRNYDAIQAPFKDNVSRFVAKESKGK